MSKPLMTTIVSTTLPCNGCTACCKGDAISIHPELGDVAEDYQTVPHFMPQLAAKGVRMLAHDAERNCVYLGEGGCTIHGRAPALCREFDCRKMAKRLGHTRARKLAKKGMVDMTVIRMGMLRMHTLTDEEAKQCRKRK
ncbi:YkgJ family cysteine cluster protein [Salmonella enterica]|nr:YkgJ family cysteine cluster protein [Salmonella enterica]